MAILPTTQQRCEQLGCKKRATTAIAFKYLWGTQLSGKGPIEHFRDDVTYRCPAHEEVNGAWGRQEIGVYRELLQSSQKAE